MVFLLNHANRISWYYCSVGFSEPSKAGHPCLILVLLRELWRSTPSSKNLRLTPWCDLFSGKSFLSFRSTEVAHNAWREKQSRAELSREEYLSASNWQLDFETSRFPNSPIARSQEYNDQTHPHLQLDRTMVSIPRVKPGDQAWWHGGK